MAGDVDLVAVGRAIGDPARAAMLLLLMDGRAHTVSELCTRVGIAASTGTMHLARLRAAGLVTSVRDGRQHLHRIASTEAAAAVEALAAVAPPDLPTSLRTARNGEHLAIARTCYGHLGGRVAVALVQHLVDDSAVPALQPGQETMIAATDHPLFRALGLARTLPRGVRGCLDWSERTPHLAGAAGRSILAALLEHNWLTPFPRGRALRVTKTGDRCLAELGIAY